MKEGLCIEFETESDGRTIIIPVGVSDKIKGKIRVIVIPDAVEIKTDSKMQEKDIPMERDDIYER